MIVGKLEILNEKLNTIKSNIPRIYEAGKKANHDSFWDTFQDYGSRVNYDDAFRTSYWNQKNFYPKYDIRIGSGNYSFELFNQGGTIFDFNQRLIDCGVTFDTSSSTGLLGLFYYSFIDNIPTIDTSNCSVLNYVFQYCRATTIQKIIFKSDGSQTFNSPFRNCVNLKNIIIEGVIGNNGIDLRESTLLSGDSIESFINALSTETSGLAITFSRTSVNNATFSSGKTWNELVSSRSNWTISLA